MTTVCWLSLYTYIQTVQAVLVIRYPSTVDTAVQKWINRCMLFDWILYYKCSTLQE